MGSRQSIDLALHTLTKAGTIRRLARGLYDFPRSHPKLGVLMPDIEKVVEALRESRRIRVQPTGAYAANILRLSEQVPAKVVFLTDGPARKVKIGNTEIRLMRTTPANMATAGRLSGLIIQAFRHLGRTHVTPERIRGLREILPAKERRALLKDLALAPAWMHPHFLELAREEEE